MTPPLEPRVIFEDAHLLVLSKPAGLLSQGGESPGENLVDWLRSHLGRPYVGLIHRLDRNTSGIMVVGKRTKAARRLPSPRKPPSNQFDLKAVAAIRRFEHVATQ